MLKQDNEEFEAKVDERTKVLKITFRNIREKSVQETSETLQRSEAKNFIEFMETELKKGEAEIKRRKELIDNMVDKRNKVVADLKKQGVKIQATLSPELTVFKEQFEAISNWQEVYGKSREEIKKQEEAIVSTEKNVEFQRKKINLVKSVAKPLDIQ